MLFFVFYIIRHRASARRRDKGCCISVRHLIIQILSLSAICQASAGPRRNPSWPDSQKTKVFSSSSVIDFYSVRDVFDTTLAILLPSLDHLAVGFASLRS